MEIRYARRGKGVIRIDKLRNKTKARAMSTRKKIKDVEKIKANKEHTLK